MILNNLLNNLNFNINNSYFCNDFELIINHEQDTYLFYSYFIVFFLFS